MAYIGIIGGLAVLALSVYAGYLWRQVFYQRAKKIEYNEYIIEKKREWIDSIILMARVINGQQASLTECAIRIKVLLDNVYEGECPQPEFRPFYELTWATSHMPILDARKQYSAKELLAFDDERVVLEEEHQQAMLKAANHVIHFNFDAYLLSQHPAPRGFAKA